MSEKKSSSATKRTRNYATVVYPESAPADWLDRLSDCRVPALVSPLHDQDINPDGEQKKPHYHVLLLFEGPKTREQAREIFDQIGGVGAEIVQSVRGYARYLCHLDNPEKHQYDTAEVRALCGADFAALTTLASDKYAAIGEMIEFCVANRIYSYAKLLLYCKESRYDWFRVLCDNGTMVMREFLKSLSWTEQQELQGSEAEYQAVRDCELHNQVVQAGPVPAADPSTGEIKG